MGVKRLQVLERRRERFEVVVVALERLRDWARQERATFMHQLLGTAPRVIFASKHGLPKMHMTENLDANLASKDTALNQDCEDIDMTDEVHKPDSLASGSKDNPLASGSKDNPLASGSKDADVKCAFAPGSRKKSDDVKCAFAPGSHKTKRSKCA